MGTKTDTSPNEKQPTTAEAGIISEPVVWFVRSSQVVNLPWALLAATSVIVAVCLQLRFLSSMTLPDYVTYTYWAVVALPVLWWAWNWAVVNACVYTVTEERMKVRKGVLNKSTHELELFRVRDFDLREPFYLRPFGLGNILIISSDRSNTLSIIKAVDNPAQRIETLRTVQRACWVKNGVREFDMPGS